MYTYKYSVYPYICIYVYMYRCIYVYMCICIYVYSSTSTDFHASMFSAISWPQETKAPPPLSLAAVLPTQQFLNSPLPK